MTSKFKGLFEAIQEPQPGQEIAQPSPDAGDAIAPPALTGLPDSQAARPTERPEPRTGRPANGKKSDPNYRQVTAYVRRDLYREVTFALHEDARHLDTKRVEFSELVDRLLERWWQERSALNGQQPGNADFRVRDT